MRSIVHTRFVLCLNIKANARSTPQTHYVTLAVVYTVMGLPLSSLYIYNRFVICYLYLV